MANIDEAHLTRLDINNLKDSLYLTSKSSESLKTSATPGENNLTPLEWNSNIYSTHITNKRRIRHSFSFNTSSSSNFAKSVTWEDIPCLSECYDKENFFNFGHLKNWYNLPLGGNDSSHTKSKDVHNVNYGGNNDTENEFKALYLRQFAHKNHFYKSDDAFSKDKMIAHKKDKYPTHFHFAREIDSSIKPVGGGHESQAVGTINYRKKQSKSLLTHFMQDSNVKHYTVNQYQKLQMKFTSGKSKFYKNKLQKRKRI